MRESKQYITWGVVGVFALIGLVYIGMLLQRWFEGDIPMPMMEQVDYGVGESARSVASFAPMAADGSALIFDESGAPDVPAEDRKIVRNASMNVVADDVQMVAGQVADYAVAQNGFVVNSSYSKEGIVPTASVSVRVPSSGLQAAMDFVSGLGDVQDSNVSGRDVTAEFVDVEAQLSNYRAAEATLLEILDRATRVEDVLQVHRELTQIRNQIERLEGRLNYLRETTELSLLTVYVSADPSGLPVLDETEEWKPLATIKSAVRGLAAFGKWIGDAVIWVVVFAPIIVFLWLVYWMYKRFTK